MDNDQQKTELNSQLKMESDPLFGEFVINGRVLYTHADAGGNFSDWWAGKLAEHKFKQGEDFEEAHRLLPHTSRYAAASCMGAELPTPYLTIKAAGILAAGLQSERGRLILRDLANAGVILPSAGRHCEVMDAARSLVRPGEETPAFRQRLAMLEAKLEIAERIREERKKVLDRYFP